MARPSSYCGLPNERASERCDTRQWPTEERGGVGRTLEHLQPHSIPALVFTLSAHAGFQCLSVDGSSLELVLVKPYSPLYFLFSSNTNCVSSDCVTIISPCNRQNGTQYDRGSNAFREALEPCSGRRHQQASEESGSAGLNTAWQQGSGEEVTPFLHGEHYRVLSCWRWSDWSDGYTIYSSLFMVVRPCSRS